MALLKNRVAGDLQVVNTIHTIGRSIKNNTYLSYSDISKIHATIFWENNEWYIKDHSRNGTLVDQRVVHHAIIKLEKDCEIQFGEENETIWTLVSIGAPNSYFVEEHAEPCKYIELSEDSLTYPNLENPLVSFYRSHVMTWMMDDGETTTELYNENRYTIDNREWIFVENDPLEDTMDQLEVMRTARLDYHLSADEENVGIHIIVNDLKMYMGDQIHNHVLLLLARKMQEDTQNKICKEDKGWVYTPLLLDNLSKELLQEIDTNYFNIMVHRIRSSFKQLKPYGYLFTNIIERKRGKLRLNYSNIRIIKEDQIQTA